MVYLLKRKLPEVDKLIQMDLEGLELDGPDLSVTSNTSTSKKVIIS
jgi:hypothetical protein